MKTSSLGRATEKTQGTENGTGTGHRHRKRLRETDTGKGNGNCAKPAQAEMNQLSFS